jgi:hypothetical protein
VRRQRASSVAVVLIVMETVSCIAGCETAHPGWRGSVRDSAGVLLVRNEGTPLWSPGEEWTLSEVLRIGSTAGPPKTMFGRIKGIAVLSDGRIVVNDAMAQELRVFYPSGEYQMTIGGPGAGPGEFGPGGLTLLVGAGDTLLVIDLSNLRANRIAPDGTWLDSWSLAPSEGWLFRDWDDSGTGRIASHMARVPGMERSAGDTFDVVVVRNLDGTPGDTLAWIAASRLRRRSTGGQPEFHFYSGEPDMDLCSDKSLVAGRGDVYRIYWYEPSGTLERVVTLERPGEPITADDRAFIERRFDETLRKARISVERINSMKDAIRFTDYYPAFGQLECGPHGTLWAWRIKPLGSLGAKAREEFSVTASPEFAPEFDVFDRQGRYLGIVSLPDGFWGSLMRRGHLYGRWTDSLGVEYVSVLEIRGEPPAPMDQGFFD